MCIYIYIYTKNASVHHPYFPPYADKNRSGSIYSAGPLFTEVINSSPPGQNGRHFADDILRCIFLNENDNIPIGISLKLVPRGPVNNKSALIQVMAWRRTGDKPLPEPVMTQFTDVYMHH